MSCWEEFSVFLGIIIPLALVGYEMITANSYPTRTRVKYLIQWVDCMYNSESPPWDLKYQ